MTSQPTLTMPNLFGNWVVDCHNEFERNARLAILSKENQNLEIQHFFANSHVKRIKSFHSLMRLQDWACLDNMEKKNTTLFTIQ